MTTRLQAGDEAAWVKFHGEYAPRLFRYLIVATGGREEAARDALQQTFLRSVRHMKVFSNEAVFWSWLTVLARSSLIDEHRKESRFQQFLTRWFGDRTAEQEPVVEQYDLVQCLKVELAALPEDERRLVEKKYSDGASTRTLAESMGATERAVESRLARIRQKLKAGILARVKNERSN